MALQYASYLQGQGNLAHAETSCSKSPNAIRKMLQVLRLSPSAACAKELGWRAGHFRCRSDHGRQSGIADQIKAAALPVKTTSTPALPLWRRLMRRLADAVQPVLSLVAAYLRAGTADKAETLLRDMLKKISRPIANCWSCWVRRSLPEVRPRRRKNPSAAISQHPKNEASYLALSKLYVRQKNYDDANNVIQAGLKERPDSVDLRLTGPVFCLARATMMPRSQPMRPF